MHMPVKNLLSAGMVLALLALTAPLSADTVDLKAGHPDRYVVQKGDTLWDISTRFLNDPWRWASVWKINEQIKNPHLIYPGDVVKLKPRVYASDIKEAIPTIPPNAIVPFLSQPMVVGRKELEEAGYVTIGLDDRVALGDGSVFYARGLPKNATTEYYQLFRKGNELRHPDTGELLAYEALYLGDARVLEPGDPTKLVVTAVKQEILPTDRLMAAPKKAALPYYFPRAPEKEVKGRILSAINGLREFGPTTIVAISVGKREGIEEGHVLRIMRHVGTSKDPVTRRDYKMPDEDAGLLMVFRVFDKVSYALIMNADRPIRIHDALRTP
jgi:LysM repeat protein